MAPSIENQPSTEELILQLKEENRALKEQLSGTDLKVFEQIRELRAKGKKQTDEIRRLTAECVQLAFRVRELETQVEEARSQAVSSQSQESELSLKLQEQLRSHEELLESVRRESQAEKKELEGLFAEREQALLREMESREEEISSLEATLSELKEQFLSAELEEEPAAAGLREGLAFQILVESLEELLGFSGRTLVEQIYSLCRAELDTEDVGLLEDVFEALQDTGTKLVRSPEQEAALTAVLERSWREVTEQLGRAAQAVAPEPAEELEPHWIEPPAAEAPAAAEPPEPAPVEAPVLEVPPEPVRMEAPAPAPEAEVPAVAAEAEAAPVEAPAAEAPEAEVGAVEAGVAQVGAPAAGVPGVEVPEEAPAEEAPFEEVPAPEAPRMEVPLLEPREVEPEVPEAPPVHEEPPAVLWPGPKEEPEAVIEVEEELPAPEPEPVPPAPPPVAEVTLDTANALLEEGQFEEAETQFRALLREDPESPDIQFGMMRACVGLQRWEDAHQFGLELAKRQHEWDEETREQVNLVRLEAIQARIQNPRSEVEVKELLLEVAEMKLPSAEALEYLDEADKIVFERLGQGDEPQQIPVRIEGEGRLSFHRVCLQADEMDVSGFLLDYMHQLGDRPELFEHIERVYAGTEFAPTAGAVLALARLPRSEAEARVATVLGPNPATKSMVEAIGDAGEEALVEVFLDHLVKRADVDLPLPCRRFQQRLQEAEPAAFVGSLRQALRHVNYTIFFDQIEVLSYGGTDRFLVDAAPVPTPTLLFHKGVDDVPPEELRFLVFRRLVQIFRRHLHLYHLAEAFDDSTRNRLIQACVQMHLDSGYEISTVLMYEVEQVTRGAASRKAVESLLWRLYEHTTSDNFLDLADFMYENRLMKKWLDPLADHFAAQVVGLAPASYATARDCLLDDPLYARIEAEGFQALYHPDLRGQHSDLRLRLQRLWMGSLKGPAEA